MTVSLRQVLAIPDLELELLTPTASVDEPLRWVAVSEQVDPTPWIEPCDLILTTGMSMGGRDFDHDAYVARLVEAGAAGLGFGVGLHHEQVPRDLVGAGERHGLPVMQVGRPVPFVAVSRAVSQLLVAEEFAESATSFDSQRRMIRSALAAEADERGASVLPILARHLRGFAIFLDSDRRVVAAWPPGADDRLSGLDDEVQRIQSRGLLASSALSSADEHLVILPVGARDTVHGLLVAGGPRSLTSADQAVLNLAVSLLSWNSTSAVRGLSPGVSADLVMDLALLEGLTPARARRVGLDRLDPTCSHVVVVRPQRGCPFDAGRWSGGGDVLISDASRGYAIGVAASSPDTTAVTLTRILQDASVASIGLSIATDLTSSANVNRALAQALDASRDRGLSVYGDRADRSMLSLVEAQEAAAWARGYLAPLSAVPEGGELVSTLKEWLSLHGQVDAAAQRLGIHRHTVRHRLRRAEAILDRSLDDPGVRADLWFALSAGESGARAAGDGSAVVHRR